jgi:hypothetical protein
MRLRFGLVFCVFAVIWGVGCRKPLTPNIDRNIAPETWITAAPVDTLTLKDANGRQLPPDPTIHVIPVRFHMYWAGSDPDGTVVGFYYAVTETTATPDPLTNEIPALPGPKPRDYHYTTRTDTTFIFNVTEGAPDRQHAFFLYAVDDHGKADATPARFMFTAIDKFPPTPIFDVAQGIGTIYQYEGGSYVNGQLVGGALVPHTDLKNFTDQSIPRTTVRDSGAVNSVLRFRWHAKLGIAGTFVKKYCYRLEETEFNCFPPSVDSAIYAGPFSAGTKVFTLRTVDQAGGARDSTRRFTLNYMPDTWFSGPDPNDSRFVQTRDDGTGDVQYMDLAGVDIHTWGGLSGTLLHRDSLKVLPLHRQPRKTFFEIYNKRLYAHAEGDTVHMNSWVLFYNGGYDKDSRYAARIDPLDPGLPPPAERPDDPVIVPGPENGSPIGFRTQVQMTTDINGQQVNFAQSGMYPIYEPTSVFRATTIGGYWPMILSGKAYALARAEDGDGQSDRKIEDARVLADLVDGNGGTTVEKQLRDREILTYYVNKSPFFLTDETDFIPKLDGSTVFTGAIWNAGQIKNLNLPSDDSDPYDSTEPSRPVGKPTPGKVLRYKITVLGKDFSSGRDTSFVWDPQTADSPYYFWLRNSPVPPTLFIVPPYIACGPVKIKVELCDCRDCERISGQGRCITRTFDATYARTYTPCTGPSSPDRGGIR